MNAIPDFSQLTPDAEVDVVRCRVYQLLAQAFSFPVPERRPLYKELWDLRDSLYPDLRDGPSPDDVGDAEMEVEYINLFDGHAQERYCKPYETLWVETDRAKRQWEVKQFYRCFGLGPDRASNDMPDHVRCELEFMHYLIHGQIISRSGHDDSRTEQRNRPEHYLRAQYDFMERHLGQWVPGFCGALPDKSPLPFYRQLCEFTGRFVADDQEWIRGQCEDMTGTQTESSA